MSSSASEADWETGRHWYALSSSGDAITINAKCQEIYLSSVLKEGETLPADLSTMNRIAYSIIAELTEIPRDRMYAMTGSGLTDSGI